MPLLKNGAIADDPYSRVQGDDALPAEGAVLVDLARWQTERDALIARDSDVGVWLASSDAPEALSSPALLLKRNKGSCAAIA